MPSVGIGLLYVPKPRRTVTRQHLLQQRTQRRWTARSQIDHRRQAARGHGQRGDHCGRIVAGKNNTRAPERRRHDRGLHRLYLRLDRSPQIVPAHPRTRRRKQAKSKRIPSFRMLRLSRKCRAKDQGRCRLKVARGRVQPAQPRAIASRPEQSQGQRPLGDGQDGIARPMDQRKAKRPQDLRASKAPRPPGDEPRQPTAPKRAVAPQSPYSRSRAASWAGPIKAPAARAAELAPTAWKSPGRCAAMVAK